VDGADRTLARRTVIVISVVLLSVLAIFLVYTTRRVLTWIVIAGFFAVALHPVVNWVQTRARWLPRWLATLLVFIVVFALLAGITALFVVPLVREGTQVIDDFPKVADDVRAGRGPIGHLLERLHLREYLSHHSDQIRSYASNLTAPTVSFLRATLTTVAGILAVFVLAYLMVLQAPRMIDAFLALFDERRAERIRRVAHDCARSVTGYISGNLLISLICGGLTYIVLLIVGVPFAGLIALFVGIADLIPLVGATLGAVAAAIPAFLHSVTAGVVVIIFFVVYQQVENHVLQPVIFSRTVRLNPLTVLVAVLIAVQLAGILGSLLAIPVASMVQVIVRDIWDERRGRPKPVPTVGDEERRVGTPHAEDGAGPSR
jgi:predicted PurR-regulated permease PerM